MFELLGTLISLFVGAAVIYAALLSVNAVINWFPEQLGHRQTYDQLAVTVLKNLQQGDYKIAQGIFTTTTQQFESQRTVEATQIYQSFLASHNENGIAVWQV